MAMVMKSKYLPIDDQTESKSHSAALLSLTSVTDAMVAVCVPVMEFRSRLRKRLTCVTEEQRKRTSSVNIVVTVEVNFSDRWTRFGSIRLKASGIFDQ